MDLSKVKDEEDRLCDTEKDLGKSVIESSDVSCDNVEGNSSVDTIDISSSSDLNRSTFVSSASVLSYASSASNITLDVSHLHTNASGHFEDESNKEFLSRSVINSSDVGDAEDLDVLASDYMKSCTSSPRQEQNVSPPPLTEKCSKHDELVKMFCRQHDEVCCSACIALYHRACDGVFFIPKLEGSILEEEKERDVTTSLESVLGDLQEMKQQRVDDLKENERDWTEDLEEIKKLKENLIARIEELESKSKNEVKDCRNSVCLGLKDEIDDTRYDK